MSKLYLLVALATLSLPTSVVNSKIIQIKTAKHGSVNRIVGGDAINIEQAPHNVQIIYNQTLICGGSIINNNHVITSAQCLAGVFRINALNLTVRSGTTKTEAGGTVHAVTGAVAHPQFDPRTNDYDAAVLTIDPSITLGPTRQPIELTAAEPVAGASATVTGWGDEYEGDPTFSETLRSVDIPILSNKRCNELYGNGMITEQMLCAGYEDGGGKDSCQGDTGGPLVVNGQLAGIVSWSYGCAQPEYPGVNTNVFTIRSWIEDNLD